MLCRAGDAPHLPHRCQESRNRLRGLPLLGSTWARRKQAHEAQGGGKNHVTTIQWDRWCGNDTHAVNSEERKSLLHVMEIHHCPLPAPTCLSRLNSCHRFPGGLHSTELSPVPSPPSNRCLWDLNVGPPQKQSRQLPRLAQPLLQMRVRQSCSTASHWHRQAHWHTLAHTGTLAQTAPNWQLTLILVCPSISSVLSLLFLEEKEEAEEANKGRP